MNISNYTHLCMHEEYTLTELVDLMVALGHMESLCTEWVNQRGDETNKNNLQRITLLKEKITQQLSERMKEAYSI